MNLENKNVWQIAAGDPGRSYPGVFLEWDVITVGPGRFGPWPDCRTEWTHERRRVARFCNEMETGDAVVLKSGIGKVYGVGIVESEPKWFDDFGDIDGWDQQHVRRVRWLKKLLDDPAEVAGLARGTLRRVRSDSVLGWLREQDFGGNIEHYEPQGLPPSCQHGKELPRVDRTSIGQHLFDQGVGGGSIDNLLNEMDELTRIARWYDRSEHAPSEYETTAYLVIPVLRALGWTPQKMAVEWQNLDAALFRVLPRSDANLAVTVEIKQKGNACLSAKSQAEEYAEKLGGPECRRLIVTDGLRYGAYVKLEDRFPDRPHAYLNLVRMVDEYPILHCWGAKEALRLMAEDWDGQLPDGDRPGAL